MDGKIELYLIAKFLQLQLELIERVATAHHLGKDSVYIAMSAIDLQQRTNGFNNKTFHFFWSGGWLINITTAKKQATEWWKIFTSFRFGGVQVMNFRYD